jgi:ribosomal protein S18 acetylase RimI-like enzyme
MAQDLHIRPLAVTDFAAVIDLWRVCNLLRPWNDPRSDIAAKLANSPDLLLVGMLDGAVVASVMIGYDGHRGWINYLAVHPDWQRHGYGRQMMDAAEDRLRTMGCAKINLQIRTGNDDAIAFYQALGFKDDQVLSMGKRLR